jgi:hypothetical protein
MSTKKRGCGFTLIIVVVAWLLLGLGDVGFSVRSRDVAASQPAATPSSWVIGTPPVVCAYLGITSSNEAIDPGFVLNGPQAPDGTARSGIVFVTPDEATPMPAPASSGSAFCHPISPPKLLDKNSDS